MNEITRVKRPDKTVRSHGESFRQALRETLASGDALSIPLNGDTYGVTRNRKASTGYALSKEMNVSLRTSRSEDGRALLIWLEAKPVA